MPKKKPARPAGDEGDDRKAMRKEIIELKTEIAKLIDGRADKILKPRKEKELPTSVPTLRGGRPESNRRKF